MNNVAWGAGQGSRELAEMAAGANQLPPTRPHTHRGGLYLYDPWVCPPNPHKAQLYRGVQDTALHAQLAPDAHGADVDVDLQQPALKQVGVWAVTQ